MAAPRVTQSSKRDRILMDDLSTFEADRVRPLIRVRQIRDFTDRVVSPAELEAIADVARWSGSSTNSQPWRFVVVRQRDTIRRLAESALPQTRALRTATAAIAIALPDEAGKAVSHAYDEGRAAERILIAASMLGLGAGITWILPDARAAIHSILAIPEGRLVRTIVALGHPSEAARAPKAAPGTARLPRNEVVFEEAWPKR
ncbi:MAG: nitroreductase family protein [Candidatus Limnocylindrales bacterium]